MVNLYIFYFWSECLRWGPTSLQTVKLNVGEVLQFVRCWGPKTKNKKHINLLEKLKQNLCQTGLPTMAESKA